MRQFKKEIPEGMVHSVPADWRKALTATPLAHALWQDITPLARNEWICWILDAKKEETRKRRIEVGLSKLKSGMRRPCCWAGCVHRSK
ncbi:MAG: YdeI/OmpD-associated family protein [Candidatus Moranbacteria bacterium]|nr:YdeI/OmpD-associated family protein [Candidatus Moranbacteria bacterium]